MITELSGKIELLTTIDQEVSELVDLFSSLDEKTINTVPFKDSWTAAQVLRHVTKSTNGMVKAMGTESKSSERNAGEKIPWLKKIFLDFSSKLKSPDFIVPEEGPYEKQAIIEELNKSFKLLKESATNANLTDIVEGLPFGAVTKLELLHFVLYHTQRHLNQLKEISETLKQQQLSLY